MSVTGNGVLSLRKKDVASQKNLTIGFRKTMFAHKATAGQTGIDFAALVAPPEMVGFVNPPLNELLATKIFFYHKNLTLVSSLRGALMDYLSYTITDSGRIDFNGFTAADGEIFIGVIDYNAVNSSIQIVDAAALIASGTLAIGVNNFNVGQVFEVNKNPSQQVGSVLVYRNGLQQFRNTNNSSVTLDANYHEVDNGSGSGSVITFNNAPVGLDDSILVISNGLVAYGPDGSALQQIEALAGQIDAMVPTLADLAGVPETDFQAAPNSVDLKSFGDQVLDHEERIVELENPTQHEIWLQDLASGADFGSTATKIRRFDTTRINAGSAITYIDSATNGASFTINQRGIYSIMFIAQWNAANDFGISLNSASLTTDITLLTDTEIIAVNENGGNDFPMQATVTLWLDVGDVVRPHVDLGATLSFTKNGVHQFRIVKVS